MKRKFLALLCIVALTVLCLASCDVINQLLGNEPPVDDTCEHTYSDKWSTSTTEHWHAATCEHAELKSDVANHTDTDENGQCDVCDYEIGHVHTFEDKWTSNDTHHWRVATCSHTEEKGELAAHTDANSDGACDTCSAHVHVLDLSGKCTVCGEQVEEIDVTDINVILPIVIANAGKISGGSIITNDIVHDLQLVDGEIVSYDTMSIKEVTYLLGDSAAYYKIDTTNASDDYAYTDSSEKWYELLEDGSVFGVYQEKFEDYVSDFMVDSAANLDNLDGYYFPLSTLTNAYGVENLLASLYALSQSDSADDYQFLYEDGTYTFVFTYLYVDTDTAEGEPDHVDFYEVGVTFNVFESGALADFAMYCNCYTNSLFDELDNDYTYDQATGTITMKDTAVADTYLYTVSQTEGKRTYVSEHPKSEFVPESFDAFVDMDCTTPLGDTVTMTEGETLNIYFGNFVPENAGATYLMDTFMATVDENAVSYWAYDGVVSFLSNTPGTYPVEFTLGDETFTFTFVVEAAVIDDGGEQPENTVRVEITDTYGWDLDFGEFTAPADGDYTFIIEAGVDLGAISENGDAPWADFYNTDMDGVPVGGSVTVSLKAGETYKFFVSSPVKNIVVYIPYTVSDYTGDNTVGGDDVVISTTIVDGENKVAFSDDEIAANTAVRTLTVSVNANYTFRSDLFVSSIVDSNGTPVAMVDYAYYLVSGETYTVTFAMLTNFGIQANKEYPLSITGDVIDDGGDEPTDVTVVTGTYVGTDAFGNKFLTVTVDETTVTFVYEHPMQGISTVVATYAFVDGAVVLYDENGNVLHPLSGALGVDAFGTPITASYNGNEYTLSTGSIDEEPEESNIKDKVCGYYEMEGYEVIISTDWDDESLYLFNAYNINADIYYILEEVIDNGDGTYTLVLGLREGDEDVFSFLTETFVVTLLEDGYKTLSGPAVEVKTVDYEDAIIGDNTFVVTQDMIDAGNVYFDIEISEMGFYVISATGLSGTFYDEYRNYLTDESSMLAPGKYVVGISTWDAALGECTFNISFVPVSELSETQALTALCGSHYLGFMECSIYGDAESGFILNVWNWDYTIDVYYDITLVKNDDGTYTITLAYNSDISRNDGFNYDGDVVIASYNDGWELELIHTPKIAPGTYKGVDNYGNEFLTLIVDRTTVTFVYEHPMQGTNTVVATYEIVDGEVVLYNENGEVLNPLAGTVTLGEYEVPVAAAFNGNNYTITRGSSSDEEVESELVLGENYVSVTDIWMGTELNFVASETGVYTVYPGYNAKVIYDFTQYVFGDTLILNLNAGDVVTLVVLTADFNPGEATLNITFEAGSSDVTPGEAAGTMDDPIVIETLPLELSFEGAHDVYYTYTSEVACTLIITYTEGSYVSGLVSFDKDSQNLLYTVYVEAGETVTINPWATSPSGVYTYTISVLEA